MAIYTSVSLNKCFASGLQSLILLFLSKVKSKLVKHHPIYRLIESGESLSEPYVLEGCRSWQLENSVQTSLNNAFSFLFFFILTDLLTIPLTCFHAENAKLVN